MRRYAAATLAIIVCAMAVASSGCSGGGDAPEPGTSDTPIEGDVIYPVSSEGGEQSLFDLACTADVLTITTSARTLRAGLPCDRLPPQQVIERFQSGAVEIEVKIGAPTKLFLRSEAGGSLEFTVENVRVDSP